MADQKTTALAEQTLVDPDDLFYFILNSGPTSKKIKAATVLGGSQAQGSNLIKNSPGQIVTDGAEPQWWDEGDGNATMTDEDAAGEGVEEKQERIFKVVTIANDKYGYQTLTFADEDLLDAGETVVSFGCWIWCAAATKASIGIFGTNLTLQESGQHTGGSSWEYFAVENITLNAADADIEIRLIVDTDTAYYCMPMLCVGPVARPWAAREINHIPMTLTHVIDTTTGDVAFSDVDFTANTDPLCLAINNRVQATEPDGSAGSFCTVAHSDDLAADSNNSTATVNVLTRSFSAAWAYMQVNDGQLGRYRVFESDADNDVAYKISLLGYWRWA